MSVNLQEFDDLINLGKITSTLEIGARKIVMRTLNSQQYAQAMSGIPDDLTSSKRFETLQREIVASSLESIDGKELDHETKVKLIAVGQLGLSNLLYTEYLKLVEEQSNTIESAKKNSSQVLTESVTSQKTPDSK